MGTIGAGHTELEASCERYVPVVITQRECAAEPRKREEKEDGIERYDSCGVLNARKRDMKLSLAVLKGAERTPDILYEIGQSWLLYAQ